jgi:hypothetical protein
MRSSSLSNFTCPAESVFSQAAWSWKLFWLMPQNSQLNAQKKQRWHYSGKKKCHTQKAQVIVEMTTGNILSATFCVGRKHDFRLFKESRIELPPHVLLLADAGYQGVAKIHPNSQTPVKKTKLHPLNKKLVTRLCLGNAS